MYAFAILLVVPHHALTAFHISAAASQPALEDADGFNNSRELGRSVLLLSAPKVDLQDTLVADADGWRHVPSDPFHIHALDPLTVFVKSHDRSNTGQVKCAPNHVSFFRIRNHVAPRQPALLFDLFVLYFFVL